MSEVTLMYEGGWVDVHMKKGLYYTTMDCINHPLDPVKSRVNLNGIVSYWRYPSYPFWVESKYFITKPHSIDYKITNVQEFMNLMSVGRKEVYNSFIILWDNAVDGYRDHLLLISRRL